MSGFVLGWTTTVHGNIKIIGRPLSEVSLTKGYDKSAVKHQIGQAVLLARQMASETQTLVSRSIPPAIEMSMGPGAFGLGTKLSPVVENAGITHFKLAPMTSANAKQWVELLNHLNQVYTLIRTGISGTIEIVDVSSAEKLDTNGSVSLANAKLLDPNDPNGPKMASRGRLHINFHWLTTRTAHRVARTIIHEASHKFTGMRDHAYKHNKVDYAALTPVQARSNADSIACFAYYTWKNGAYKLEA